MHFKNPETEATVPPRPKQTNTIATAQRYGSIPTELMRHVCLATAAIWGTYWLSQVRAYPMSLLLVVASCWVAARTLGALRCHRAAVGVSLGALVLLLFARALHTRLVGDTLDDTYQNSLVIYISMLLTLVSADVLDLFQSRRHVGRRTSDIASRSTSVRPIESVSQQSVSRRGRGVRSGE